MKLSTAQMNFLINILNKFKSETSFVSNTYLEIWANIEVMGKGCATYLLNQAEFSKNANDFFIKKELGNLKKKNNVFNGESAIKLLTIIKGEELSEHSQNLKHMYSLRNKIAHENAFIEKKAKVSYSFDCIISETIISLIKLKEEILKKQKK